MEGHLDNIVTATDGIKEEYAKMKKAHEDRIDNLTDRIDNMTKAMLEMKKAHEDRIDNLTDRIDNMTKVSKEMKETLEAQKMEQKEMKETLEAKINDLAGNLEDYKLGISNKVLDVKGHAEQVVMHTEQVKILVNGFGLDHATIEHINNGADLAKQCFGGTEQLYHMARGGVVNAENPEPSISEE